MVDQKEHLPRQTNELQYIVRIVHGVNPRDRRECRQLAGRVPHWPQLRAAERVPFLNLRSCGRHTSASSPVLSPGGDANTKSSRSEPRPNWPPDIDRNLHCAPAVIALVERAGKTFETWHSCYTLAVGRSAGVHVSMGRIGTGSMPVTRKRCKGRCGLPDSRGLHIEGADT